MSTISERLNLSLSPSAVQDIGIGLDLLEAELMGFRTLTSEEKNRKIRIGTNNLAFLHTAKDAFDDMPELFPAYLNPTVYENDLTLFMDLRPIRNRLEQIIQLVDDTSVLVGDHVFKDSLEVFRSAKDGTKRGLEGARLWAKLMEARFEGQGVQREEEEPDDAPMEGEGPLPPDGPEVIAS